MAVFAVISNNTVINSIVAESIELAEELTGEKCVEANANIGFIYDESTGEFIDPETIEIAEEELAEIVVDPNWSLPE